MAHTAATPTNQRDGGRGGDGGNGEQGLPGGTGPSSKRVKIKIKKLLGTGMLTILNLGGVGGHGSRGGDGGPIDYSKDVQPFLDSKRIVLSTEVAKANNVSDQPDG